MANHTSTHMLNHALRTVLGDGVDQQGSAVNPEDFRFDFSYSKPMSLEELSAVEKHVGELIRSDALVDSALVPLDEAKRIHGIRAMFGEVYPDPVRVVVVGASIKDVLADPESERWYRHSVELCGGTHLALASQAGAFVVVSEDAQGAGIRRLIGVTGDVAVRARADGQALLREMDALEALEGGEALRRGVVAMSERLAGTIVPATVSKTIRPRLDVLQNKIKDEGKGKLSSAKEVAEEHAKTTIAALAEATPSPNVHVAVVGCQGQNKLMDWCIKEIRKEHPATSVLLLSVSSGKKAQVALKTSCSPEAIAAGLKANEWANETAKAIGGRGGGKKTGEDGNGSSKNVDAVDAAAEAGLAYAKEKLGA